MKLEYLKEAYEAAGLERSLDNEPYDMWWLSEERRSGERLQEGVPATSPALTAYAASRLAYRAWHVSGLDWLNKYEAGAHDSRDRALEIAIAALMVELGEWSEEMMREALAEEEER